MAPINNETHITPGNVNQLTNKKIGVVPEESKRRQSETAITLDHKETTSQAPRWTGKLYSDPTAPADNRIGKQHTLNREYNGTTLTYARLNGIEKAFQKQGIEVKDFDSREEVTVYLKEIFRDYKDKFPGLWKEDDWYSVDYRTMYRTLLGPYGALKNTPYVGCQISTGNRARPGLKSCLWLPLRMRGKFVYVGSDRGGQRASFDHGSERSASLVAGF